MSATQTIPVVVPIAPVVAVALVVPVAPVATVAPVTPGRRPTKAHKNANYVLEMPEIEGPEGQKSTKTPILYSKCPTTGVPKAKKAQKTRFCARNDGKRGSRRSKVHTNADFVLECVSMKKVD